MPRGIPNSGVRAKGLGPSGNIQRLIDMRRELDERIDVERAKDRARALLLAFAQKHGLSAIDLRNAAKLLGDRQVGDAPVVTKVNASRGKIKRHMLKPPKGKVGKAIRAARLKLDMASTTVGDAIGCVASLISKWELGVDPVPARFHEPLMKVLKLPKGTFPLANGHASEPA
jgi:hypothetical protein